MNKNSMNSSGSPGEGITAKASRHIGLLIYRAMIKGLPSLDDTLCGVVPSESTENSQTDRTVPKSTGKVS